MSVEYFTSAVGPYQTRLKAGTASYFAVVPYRCTVTSGSFYLYSTVTANHTNYLTISLAKRHRGAFTVIASGHTTPSGPRSWQGNLAYGRSYSWEPSWFDPTAARLVTGDTLALHVTAHGSAVGPTGQVAVTVGLDNRSTPPVGRIVVGAHSNNWSTDNATIGPLKAQRVFYPHALPASFPGTIADGYPDDVTVFVSYKTRTTNVASYVNSIPSTKDIRLIYHHEPENDYASGSTFVDEFTEQYELVKATDRAVPFGMAAMSYQYAGGRHGQDGSFLPPADRTDFYAVDNYERTPDGSGLAHDAEFLGWYDLVKDSGVTLGLTEYGVGDLNAGDYSAQRVRAMRNDDAWLSERSDTFGFWLYWYSSGSHDSNWAFTDRGSIEQWRSICAEHNVGATARRGT